MKVFGMNWIDYFLVLFAASWAGVGLFRWYAVRKGMLDAPNDRSSHKEPKPRGGGIIFVLGSAILAGALYYYNILEQHELMYFAPALIVGLLGFMDDKYGLSATVRFFVQSACAVVMLFLLKEGGHLAQQYIQEYINIPLPLSFLLLTGAVVWFTNLFNFMDGTDGIAATEALFCLGIGGFIIFQSKGYDYATFAWGICALVAGFLTWNWPNAKLFMGDSGSGFLGFIIAGFALISCKLFNISIIVWLILTSLFWFDASVTLLRRIWAKEKWLKPHRKHAYQRMAQAGWSHGQVLVSTIMINSILSSMAIWAFYRPQLAEIILMMSVAFLTTIYILVELVKPMFHDYYMGIKRVEDLEEG